MNAVKDAQEPQAAGRLGAGLRLVLADAAGEHQGVQAAERGGHRGDLRAQPVCVHVQRQPGARVTPVGGEPYVAQVPGTTRQASAAPETSPTRCSETSGASASALPASACGPPAATTSSKRGRYTQTTIRTYVRIWPREVCRRDT